MCANLVRTAQSFLQRLALCMQQAHLAPAAGCGAEVHHMMHPLQDGKCLINLQELEGAACPPPLLLCFAVVDVPLVLCTGCCVGILVTSSMYGSAYVRYHLAGFCNVPYWPFPSVCKTAKCTVTHHSLQKLGIPTKDCTDAVLVASTMHATSGETADVKAKRTQHKQELENHVCSWRITAKREPVLLIWGR